MSQLKHVIHEALNVDIAPRWVVDKFTGYFAKYGRPDGFCDWSEFSKALRAVVASCESEATSRPAGFPQWIIESRKVTNHNVTATNIKSTYQVRGQTDRQREREEHKGRLDVFCRDGGDRWIKPLLF